MRADSSPQFSKDYLIVECDYVRLESVYSLDPGSVLKELTWDTRVLPIQVLGRKATSTAFKYRALLRSVHLETGNTSLAKVRTSSFLNDMGVESKLSLLPNIDGEGDQDGQGRRAFPNTLPLHDIDHSLHHTMEELRECWTGELFDLFDRQLNTLAKYFSKADNLERFRKHFIWDNEQIQGQATKKSLARMFQNACPTFIKHRWEYRYEVLSWMTQRSDFLIWLLDPSSLRGGRKEPSEGFDPDYSFSDAEIRCLEVLTTDQGAATFWAMAHAQRLLCEWGHDVSSWLHGCHCHPTKEDAQLNFDFGITISMNGYVSLNPRSLTLKMKEKNHQHIGCFIAAMRTPSTGTALHWKN